MKKKKAVIFKNQTDLICCDTVDIGAITCDGYCATVPFISHQETFSLSNSRKNMREIDSSLVENIDDRTGNSNGKCVPSNHITFGLGSLMINSYDVLVLNGK